MTGENQRLTIALGIVATGIAVKTLDLSKGSLSYLTGLIAGTLYVASVLAFVYLLLTAAKMKYKDNDAIGSVPFTESTRRFCYDFAINAFGFNFVVWLGYVVGLGLKQVGIERHYYRYGVVCSAAVLLIYTVLVIWMKGKHESFALESMEDSEYGGSL